jgi:hypothetical protein
VGINPILAQKAKSQFPIRLIGRGDIRSLTAQIDANNQNGVGQRAALAGCYS